MRRRPPAEKLTDLRAFLKQLDADGDLLRVTAPVDPDQEITIIQHRVMARNGGPALLFENVIGSPYRLVCNLFGTQDRVARVFGGDPGRVGEGLLDLAERLMPPTLKGLWRARNLLLPLTSARLRRVASGPVLATVTAPARLDRLPVLTCWPEDGGPFFTLPLVHTSDPETGQGNLGMYRLQRFGPATTGMHWQIEKGGGFHFHRAAELGRSLPVSVFLGGPPALIIAAIAPLPEGIDERLLAAYLSGRPLKVIARPATGHLIPADAEFVLEGTVSAGDTRWEGPFGDHFGHYSHAADYPVYRVDRVLARQDAIYPATVVGKPVQEDYHIGVALAAMSVPLLKLIRPAVVDLWAFPETGFHPLAAMAVKERYPREALKHTLGMLGEGQVSLTKVMVTTGPHVNVRDFKAVSEAIWRHLDMDTGLHLLAPTAQDTLDFTGPKMNTGSRLILLAVGEGTAPLRSAPPPAPPAADRLGPHVAAIGTYGPAFLLVQVDDQLGDLDDLQTRLAEHPQTQPYLFHVLLSADVDLTDPLLTLWAWFTRFDPLVDIHPADRERRGNRLRLRPPILIDARWKKGYPKPVAFDPAIERSVLARWTALGLPD
ncbi:MAG: UbiD family decarboxylase [Desulfosarcinaceae bacterium]|nr:UbiD family decarboxylase [Desulfosarcinaceae bacterium]